VFCQLEVLRHCLPASIRQTLDQLPESLDETYLSVLRKIPEANQAHAHRMLQCLMVAFRPLSVEELAELLVFEFDEAQGGIPKYRAAWRLDDQTQAVLSTCSSLVTIIGERWTNRQIVQFSHFSVKEFLISNRLGDFSRYHIRPVSAHAILTQACLGSLLRLENHIDSVKHFPLAQYAAQYWVWHARFEDVASRVKHGMEILFDPDKPYFATWIGLFDIDKPILLFSNLRISSRPNPNTNPLYYSVLCGFYDLVKHLAIKYPQQVNAICGQYRYPLFAALSQGRIDVVELLLEHGANINSRATTGETILLEVLLQSTSQPRRTGWSPPHLVKYGGPLEVAQKLVRHNADINSQDGDGRTPLHMLSESRIDDGGILSLALVLLKHGAEVNPRDKNNQTPLHLAVRWGRFRLTEILLEHGADPEAEDINGKTALHMLSDNRIDDVKLTLLLLKHGAEVNPRDKNNQTPLHLAVRRGRFRLTEILLEHGADPKEEDINGKTALHMLSENRIDDVKLTLLLLKHGPEVNTRDKNNQTPLHLAVRWGRFRLAEILLEHGADPKAEDISGKTTLHMLSESGIDDVKLTLLSLKHGPEVNTRDKNNQTPLHLAVKWDRFRLAEILLEHGADTNAEDNNGKTVLHILSESCIDDEGGVLNLALLLLKRGVQVNAQDRDDQTSLHLAIGRRQFKLAGTLLQHGADPNVEDNMGKTPLYILLERRIDDIGGVGKFLKRKRPRLMHDAEDNKTSLFNADASVENKRSDTPVCQSSRGQYDTGERSADVAQLILELSVNIDTQVNAQDEKHDFGPVQMAQALIDHGANVNAGNDGSEIALYQESSCLSSSQKFHENLKQRQFRIPRKQQGPGGHILEGEYHIQCDSFGITRRSLTRAWRSRCTRTKEEPPDPVALGIVVWEARDRTGAARWWCNRQLEGSFWSDPIAPSSQRRI
jgi:ankyrin repeat protein